jgi:membrane protein implicated in regulation of membrane protease activity
VFWLEIGEHALAHWVILAVFVALAIYTASLFFQKKGFFVWAEAVAFCFFSPIFFLHPHATLKLAIALASSLLFVIFFFSPVLLFQRGEKRRKEGGEERTERRTERVAAGRANGAETSEATATFDEEFFRKEAPMPVFTDIREVQLGYAFEVLRKLRKAKLNERDRMETDVIQNMLTVYSAKERLNTEEVHALNGYLSSLLKLMAAYSV